MDDKHVPLETRASSKPPTKKTDAQLKACEQEVLTNYCRSIVETMGSYYTSRFWGR